MAVEAGAKVIATTRNRERFGKLEGLGAYRAEIESPDLSKRIAERKHIDAVLDLVGNSTILDSLWMLRRGGRACLAGWVVSIRLPTSIHSCKWQAASTSPSSDGSQCGDREARCTSLKAHDSLIGGDARTQLASSPVAFYAGAEDSNSGELPGNNRQRSAAERAVMFGSGTDVDGGITDDAG